MSKSEKKFRSPTRLNNSTRMALMQNEYFASSSSESDTAESDCEESDCDTMCHVSDETEAEPTEANTEGTDASTPVKKAKRMCRYHAEYSVEFSWCVKSPRNMFAAECNLCRKLTR